MPDVIADTSPLQYLHRLALLNLLHQLYGTVVVPLAVVHELQSGATLGADVPDVSTVSWIQGESVPPAAVQTISPALGRGEREVIALALSKPTPLLLLDNAGGRREAQRLSIPFTGVLGILLKAKQIGAVGQVRHLLDVLQKEGFYLDIKTRTQVLQLAGEIP
jgi:predicted nucleic acid-binding protein